MTRGAALAARGRPTPFYLFDAGAARAALRRWKRAAGPQTRLFYPWKCNRHPELLDLAAREGFGAEVTTADDVAAALDRSRQGSDVIFQGPAKDRPSLDRAIAAGAWLVADSMEDAWGIVARAAVLGVAPLYLLRFAPARADESQARFGLAPTEAVSLCRRLARENRPLPAGLAFHLGTGLASPAPYVSAVREAGALAQKLAREGCDVAVLDVGGGFPSASERRRSATGRPRPAGASPDAFLAAIRRARSRHLPRARLFLEPGRAIAGGAFDLVTRVVRVVGRRVYLDASRVSHAFFVPRGVHPFRPVPLRPGGAAFEVAGTLPVDLDVFSRRETLGRPREGDLVVIGAVGAYNLAAVSRWAGREPAVVRVGASRF